MSTAIKTTPATVTPHIRPTKNINDYSNQNHTSYCNTTNKIYKKTKDWLRSSRQPVTI